MKISKQAANAMVLGSIAGLFGTGLAFPSYFRSKRAELLNNSPTYMGLKEVEKKLPEYEQKLAACVPREKGGSVLEHCVELAANYDSLINQQTNLKNSPEYHATVEKNKVLDSHQRYSVYFGFSLFMVTYVVGFFALQNRNREEADEFSTKKLEDEELDKLREILDKKSKGDQE